MVVATVPARAAFDHEEEGAVLANSNTIGESEFVDEHGGLFGGRVVLDEAARVVGFHEAVDELPALPVRGAVGEVEVALVVEVEVIHKLHPHTVDRIQHKLRLAAFRSHFHDAQVRVGNPELPGRFVEPYSQRTPAHVLVGVVRSQRTLGRTYCRSVANLRNQKKVPSTSQILF